MLKIKEYHMTETKSPPLSKLGSALLRCAYTNDPLKDTKAFYALATEDKKISGTKFCDATREIVEHHMTHINSIVRSLARFLSVYRDEMSGSEESKERKEAREEMEAHLKTFLLYQYRPEDRR